MRSIEEVVRTCCRGRATGVGASTSPLRAHRRPGRSCEPASEAASREIGDGRGEGCLCPRRPCPAGRAPPAVPRRVCPAGRAPPAVPGAQPPITVGLRRRAERRDGVDGADGGGGHQAGFSVRAKANASQADTGPLRTGAQRRHRPSAFFHRSAPTGTAFQPGPETRRRGRLFRRERPRSAQNATGLRAQRGGPRTKRPAKACARLTSTPASSWAGQGLLRHDGRALRAEPLRAFGASPSARRSRSGTTRSRSPRCRTHRSPKETRLQKQ